MVSYLPVPEDSQPTKNTGFATLMPRPSILTPLMALLLFALAPVGALGQDLYSGMVPVSGQGEAERSQALPDALIQVLQKLSGQRDLPVNEALENGLASAEQMLLAFSYQEFTRTLPDGTEQEQLRLIARFVPSAVDTLVREIGLRRWRLERQPIVIWAVVDDGLSPRRLQPFEYQYAWDTVEDVARLRGLPVAWPGLSEEMAAAIDLQSLWGGYTDQLVAEGSDAEGVVIVAARREGPEWNLRWTYADTNASSSWRTRDRELSFAMVDGIHRMTDLVASVNSIGAAGLGEWQVELLVSGLRGAGDYERALGYLEGMSLVDGVGVLGASSAGVRFRLDLNAEPAYLQRTLDQGGVLERGEADFEYRMRP